MYTLSFKNAVQPVWVFKSVVVYLSCIWLILVLSVLFTVDVAFLLMTTWQPWSYRIS